MKIGLHCVEDRALRAHVMYIRGVEAVIVTGKNNQSNRKVTTREWRSSCCESRSNSQLFGHESGIVANDLPGADFLFCFVLSFLFV